MMAPKTNKGSKVTPTEESSSELQEDDDKETATSKLYSCPQDGCVKVFQRFVT